MEALDDYRLNFQLALRDVGIIIDALPDSEPLKHSLRARKLRAERRFNQRPTTNPRKKASA